MTWFKKFLLLMLVSPALFAAEKVVDQSVLDPFYDFNADYEHFEGRVSDRDNSNSVFKIYSTNKNIKYFKVGDPLKFSINNSSRPGMCEANIRDVEDGYIVIYVKNLGPCWNRNEFLKRGTILNFESEVFSKRVEESSLYRMVLLKRREDYIKQMNDINRFIWSYDEQKILLASEYDKKIAELEQAKQKALDEILNKKKYNVHLQKEIAYRLDLIDKDIDFYRISPVPKKNIWSEDHHLDKSVGTRPQDEKERVMPFDVF